ncbi:MAG: fibronectin type III domain-containing protein [Deltaproteobacteria bacterium]|nr:fibronectin type III domain-containing protein [Deltaproteobacteria bacterium]
MSLVILMLGGYLCWPDSALAERAVTLEWDAPTTNEDHSPLTDLAGYILRQTNPGGSEKTTNLDLKNGESFKVSGLLPGNTYIFAVAAVDFSGNQSAWSNMLKVVIPAASIPTPTPAPTPAPDGDHGSIFPPTPTPTPSKDPRHWPPTTDFNGSHTSDLASASKTAGEFKIYLSDLEPADGTVISGKFDALDFGAGTVDKVRGLQLITASPARASAKKGKSKRSGKNSKKISWQTVDPFSVEKRDWTTFGRADDKPIFGCSHEGLAVPAVVQTATSQRPQLKLKLAVKKAKIKLPLETREVLCSSSASSNVYALYQRGRKVMVRGLSLDGKITMKEKTPKGLKKPHLFVLPAGQLGPETVGLIGKRDNKQVVALWSAKTQRWLEDELPLKAEAVRGLAVGTQGTEYRWLGVQRKDRLDIVSFKNSTNAWTSDTVEVGKDLKLANQALRLRRK